MKKNSWHLCWIWVFHFIRPKTGENLSQNLVQKSIQHKNRLRMRLRPVLSVQTGPIGPFPAFLPPDPLRRPHLKAARPCSTSIKTGCTRLPGVLVSCRKVQFVTKLKTRSAGSQPMSGPMSTTETPQKYHGNITEMPRKTTENHRKSQKIMENHGKSWKITENHGRVFSCQSRKY